MAFIRASMSTVLDSPVVSSLAAVDCDAWIVDGWVVEALAAPPQLTTSVAAARATRCLRFIDMLEASVAGITRDKELPSVAVPMVAVPSTCGRHVGVRSA